MDPSKLVPAEAWRPENWDALTLQWLKSAHGRNELEFLKLARAAFDVQMRRGWHAVPSSNGAQWLACKTTAIRGLVTPESVADNGPFADPFTALVEADRWYREHVEGAPTPPQ